MYACTCLCIVRPCYIHQHRVMSCYISCVRTSYIAYTLYVFIVFTYNVYCVSHMYICMYIRTYVIRHDECRQCRPMQVTPQQQTQRSKGGPRRNAAGRPSSNVFCLATLEACKICGICVARAATRVRVDCALVPLLQQACVCIIPAAL